MPTAEYLREWRKKHPGYNAEKVKIQYQKTKNRVIEHYSMGTMVCSCCGSPNDLTVNHIDSVRSNDLSGNTLYRYLVKNRFPEGYDIRCWLCNTQPGLCFFHLLPDMESP